MHEDKQMKTFNRGSAVLFRWKQAAYVLNCARTDGGLFFLQYKGLTLLNANSLEALWVFCVTQEGLQDSALA